MKLTSVRLQNVACFDDVTLRFTDERTGLPSPWIVLLGENGTGKSTILQMITAALLGKEQLSLIASGIDWGGYVRSVAQESEDSWVTIDVLAEPGDRPNYGPYPNQQGKFWLGMQRRPRRQDDYADSPFPIQVWDGDIHGWFACGYSPWRRLNRRMASNNNIFPEFSEKNRAYGFGTIFGDERCLTSVTDWIADLYFATLHPERTPEDERRFNIAVQALEKALHPLKFHDVTRNREVRFTEYSTPVPLERLSDGYRSTLVWTVDLIRRLIDTFPDSSITNPLEANGVVLIDEIDLHLHPRWQREIVERTRELFPNLQFIVATHSPFVAQDMRTEDQLIVLKREEKGKKRAVRIEQGGGFAQGWRADQILTSYLFGLEGTRDNTVLKAEKEYERLLDSQASGTLTPKRSKRLETIQQFLAKVTSPPGETEEDREIYRLTDEVIEALTGMRLPTEEEIADMPDDDTDLFLNGRGTSKT